MNENPILRHAGIPVKNLERAIEFYKNLGFRMVTYSQERWPRALEVVKMAAPGEKSCIELVQAHAGIWYPHVAVSVPEIDRWVGQVQFFKEPAYFILDPDKNFVELVEVKE